MYVQVVHMYIYTIDAYVRMQLRFRTKTRQLKYKCSLLFMSVITW